MDIKNQGQKAKTLCLTFYVCNIRTINPNASPITVMKFGFIALGRGRRDRTLGTRFWSGQVNGNDGHTTAKNLLFKAVLKFTEQILIYFDALLMI